MEMKLLQAKRQKLWYDLVCQAKFSKIKTPRFRHVCGIRFTDVLAHVKGEHGWDKMHPGEEPLCWTSLNLYFHLKWE